MLFSTMMLNHLLNLTTRRFLRTALHYRPGIGGSFNSSSIRGPHWYSRQLQWHSTTKDDGSMEAYFNSLGIDPELHNDVLKSANRLVGNDLTTVASLSQALGGDTSVVELAKSIQNEQKKKRRKAKRKQRPMINITFRVLGEEETKSPELSFSWKYGEPLLSLSQSQPVQEEFQRSLLEGTCGGQMACSTCQVYLDQVTYDALSPPTEEEIDILELAFEPKSTSRLGCQVKLDDSLIELAARHDIVITIPSNANDEWKGA